MQSVGLSGRLPQELFSFPELYRKHSTLLLCVFCQNSLISGLSCRVLSDNQLNGTLDMGSNISNKLDLVDIQNNKITSVTVYNNFNIKDLKCVSVFISILDFLTRRVLFSEHLYSLLLCCFQASRKPVLQ
jgi:hypothetical protein